MSSMSDGTCWRRTSRSVRTGSVGGATVRWSRRSRSTHSSRGVVPPSRERSWSVEGSSSWSSSPTASSSEPRAERVARVGLEQRDRLPRLGLRPLQTRRTVRGVAGVSQP